ncbi:MAG: HAD-IIIA family hydrolase [Chromatiales bacterium]|nr:HAD-IIIA family hydrolase [Chromatiales bacterium]
MTGTTLLERAARVRLLVLDVDGVLTDGRLHYDADGREFKSFHVRDGLGLRRCMQGGIEVAVISGRRSPATEARMSELGVRHVLLGHEDKRSAWDTLLAQLAVAAEDTACVGDDLPDLPLLERAGLAIAVADAEAALREASHWVTTRRGGRGAVREVCDLLLAARTGRLPAPAADG